MLVGRHFTPFQVIAGVAGFQIAQGNRACQRLPTGIGAPTGTQGAATCHHDQRIFGQFRQKSFAHPGI